MSSERAAQDPDTMVEVADLEKFEEENGRIPDLAVVIMRSGWGAKLVFKFLNERGNLRGHYPLPYEL